MECFRCGRVKAGWELYKVPIWLAVKNHGITKAEPKKNLTGDGWDPGKGMGGGGTTCSVQEHDFSKKTLKRTSMTKLERVSEEEPRNNRRVMDFARMITKMH